MIIKHIRLNRQWNNNYKYTLISKKTRFIQAEYLHNKSRFKLFNMKTKTYLGI